MTAKKLFFISFPLALSLMVIGAFLKIFHLSLGELALAIALLVLALIAIPSLAVWGYQRLK